MKNLNMTRLLSLAGAACLALAPSGLTAANFTIEMRNNFFSPANQTVNVGDSITWKAVQAGHNTVSATGGWSSAILNTGQFTFTFNTAGKFHYICEPHVSFGMAGDITVLAANTPPTVSLTAPAGGATFLTTDSVTLSATAADPGGSVAKVEFFEGATSLGSDTSSPYSISLAFAAGSHTVTAKATDNLGATTTSAAVTFTVNQAAPAVVAITKPAANARVLLAPANFSLEADASEPGATVTKVEYFNGAASLGVATAPPFRLDLANQPAGKYTVTATSTSSRGTVTTSDPITVIVAVQPKIVLTEVLPTKEFRFTVNGTTGLPHVSERSADLRVWTPFSTNTTVRGAFSATDTAAPSSANKFYRVVVR